MKVALAKWWSNLSWSKFVLILTMGIMIYTSSNLNWGKSRWQQVLLADAKGYYAYLPAVFIFQDLNFQFYKQVETPKYNWHKYDYRTKYKGHRMNKYYSGTAVAQMPFFLIAHGLARLLDIQTYGYSKMYIIAVNIAALFYLLIGLIFLNRTLKLYEVEDRYRALTIIAIAFGTNLFLYSVKEMGMSHVYSFAFMSIFLYYSKRYFSSFGGREMIILALSLGMIVLIRPLNVLLFLLWPFIAERPAVLWKGIKSGFFKYKYFTLAVLSFVAVISIQFIIYKIATGDFFVYAYGKEKFYFNKPHFIDMLFSYKKGLFLYTPMYLLSLIGGLVLWKSNRFALVSGLLFFTLITYIFSCWWMWFYGGSFSSRVHIEFLPFFGILIGLALQRMETPLLRKAFVCSIVVFTIFCQIQTFQYRKGDIHYQNMTKEKYWNVFLKVGKYL